MSNKVDDFLEFEYDMRLISIERIHAAECEESHNEILRLKSALKEVDHRFGSEYKRAERLQKELNKKQLERYLNIEGTRTGRLSSKAPCFKEIDHNSDQELIEELREDSRLDQQLIKHLRAKCKSLQQDKDNLKDRLARISRAVQCG
jgi:hypothetical protein